MKKILIVRIDGMGDNIMNTAFTREFYNNVKDSNTTVDILLRPYVYPILKNMPYIDNILLFWDAHSDCLRSHMKSYASILLQYDWVVMPRYGSDRFTTKVLYAFELYKQIRISGMSTCSNNVKYDPHRILTDCFTRNEPEHDVKCSMKFLNYLGYNEKSDHIECWPDNYDELIVNSILNRLGNKYVCVCIGASCNERKWDLKNYKIVIEYIRDTLGVPVVIMGGSDVKQNGITILNDMNNQDNVVNTVGAIELKDTYELMKRSVCVISNDSGALHLAATTNKPVIGLYRDGYVPSKTPIYYSEPVRHYPYCDEYYCITPLIQTNNLIVDPEEVCDATKYVLGKHSTV